MRITTSDPALKKKIKLQLDGPTDVVHWYIRFNIPLDEQTVNDQTMKVTDTDGYIMRTDISYQAEQNRICISPLDTYEEGRFYLLNITKKVCSARGQPLKTKIHILFKLYKAQVSEYKIMRQDVNVPKPKVRPANYEALQANRPPNAIDMAYGDVKPPTAGASDRMATLPVKINMWMGLVGFVLALLGFALNMLWVMALAVGVIIIGVTHLVVQLRDKDIAAKMHYNSGVRLFNQSRYSEARVAFEKCNRVNPGNEYAKYGLHKVGFYQ
jgi:hypothetical protein